MTEFKESKLETHEGAVGAARELVVEGETHEVGVAQITLTCIKCMIFGHLNAKKVDFEKKIPPFWHSLQKYCSIPTDFTSHGPLIPLKIRRNRGLTLA